MDTRDLSLTAIFASLYFVINTLQTMVGGPITYGPIQFRVVDCLLALAALFGWPVVFGVTVGTFLANAYYFLGPLDVMLGPIANFIAASLILLLRNRRLLACAVGALPVGIIVGGYLWTFFPPHEILSFLPVWAAMIASITISSLIAVGMLGYLLCQSLEKAFPELVKRYEQKIQRLPISW